MAIVAKLWRMWNPVFVKASGKYIEGQTIDGETRVIQHKEYQGISAILPSSVAKPVLPIRKHIVR